MHAQARARLRSLRAVVRRRRRVEARRPQDAPAAPAQTVLATPRRDSRRRCRAGSAHPAQRRGRQRPPPRYGRSQPRRRLAPSLQTERDKDWAANGRAGSPSRRQQALQCACSEVDAEWPIGVAGSRRRATLWNNPPASVPRSATRVLAAHRKRDSRKREVHIRDEGPLPSRELRPLWWQRVERSREAASVGGPTYLNANL